MYKKQYERPDLQLKSLYCNDVITMSRTGYDSDAWDNQTNGEAIEL